MAFVVERFTDKPVLVSQILEDYEMEVEQAALLETVRFHLDEAQVPLYYIIDFTQAALDFQALLGGPQVTVGIDAFGGRHDNVRELLVIRRVEAAQGADANDDTAFPAPYRVFSTLEYALDYLNQQV